MIPQHEDERRILVGEHVLGLLEGPEAAETEAWIAKDKQAAAMALAWHNHFLGLVDRLPPVAPSDQLWSRVLHSVGTSRGAAKAASQKPREPFSLIGLWRDVSTWRWASVGFAAVAILFATVPFSRDPVVPDAPRVAVMQAPGEAAKPGWVVSVLNNGDVQLKGLAPLATPEGRSIQIWTLGPNEKKPRSLGLLTDTQSAHLTAAQVGPVEPGQLFEFTVEQEGGSPTGQPTGPILFLGRIVATAL